MTEQPQMSHHHRRSRKVLPDCGSPSHFRSEISPASRRREYPIDPVPPRCPMLSRCRQASSRNCHPADPCTEASPLDFWCFSHRAKAWHDIASLEEIAVLIVMMTMMILNGQCRQDLHSAQCCFRILQSGATLLTAWDPNSVSVLGRS